MEPGGRHSPDSLRPTECSTSTIRQEFSSSRSTIDTNLDCVLQSLAIHTVDSIIIWHRDLVLWPILNNNNQVRPHPPPSQLNNNFNWELYTRTNLSYVIQRPSNKDCHIHISFETCRSVLSSLKSSSNDEIGNLECLPSRFMIF